MKKIICFNSDEERIPFIENWAKEHNVQVDTVSDFLTIDNVDLVSGYDGVTIAEIGKFDSRIFPELSKRGIKQIAQRSAGYEYFDLEEAKKHNILISNVPSYSPESIAEFSLLMGLQLIRNSQVIAENVNNKNFQWGNEIRGRIISGKNVAILGVGNIGFQVAKLYNALGARVIGYDPFPKNGAENILTYYSTVSEAVKQADIISLHMPALEENYHLFDDEMFNLMKNNAHLVNAGRGSLIDTRALIDALDDEKLASAALDVYENESKYVPGDFRDKDIEDNTFQKVLNHPKIIFTPHCAFYTDDSVKNMTYYGLDATLDVINTGTTQYKVN